jgi:hypothetical protein
LLIVSWFSFIVTYLLRLVFRNDFRQPVHEMNDDEQLDDHPYILLACEPQPLPLSRNANAHQQAVTAARRSAAVGQLTASNRKHHASSTSPFNSIHCCLSRRSFSFSRERVAFLLRERKKATESLQSEKLNLKKNR